MKLIVPHTHDFRLKKYTNKNYLSLQKLDRAELTDYSGWHIKFTGSLFNLF
jgi:hypothetical protein